LAFLEAAPSELEFIEYIPKPRPSLRSGLGYIESGPSDLSIRRRIGSTKGQAPGTLERARLFGMPNTNCLKAKHIGAKVMRKISAESAILLWKTHRPVTRSGQDVKKRRGWAGRGAAAKSAPD